MIMSGKMSTVCTLTPFTLCRAIMSCIGLLNVMFVPTINSQEIRIIPEPIEATIDVNKQTTPLIMISGRRISSEVSEFGQLRIRIGAELQVSLPQRSVITSCTRLPEDSGVILLIKREMGKDAFVFDRVVVIEFSSDGVLWKEVINVGELANTFKFSPFISEIRSTDEYPVIKFLIGYDDKPEPPSRTSYALVQFDLIQQKFK